MKLNNLLLFAFAAFSIIVMFDACQNEIPTSSDDNTTNPIDSIPSVTYTNSIKKLFDFNCALSGCHNSGSIFGSLANYTSAKSFVSIGRILGAIKHENGYSAMPRDKPKLPKDNIDNIEKWIDDGTPE
jgi:hypothetical protein